jgi:hypothetical protein
MIAQDEQRLLLLWGGQPVVQLNTAVMSPPEGIDPVYSRSGHLHPLWTPEGRIVTEAFPANHPHQHGVFHAWVRTTFEGRSVDFWNQLERTGDVRLLAVESRVQGPLFAEVTAALEHASLDAAGNRMPVLYEQLSVRAWTAPAELGRILDVSSVQTCSADSALRVEGYHYGGFAVRGAREWQGVDDCRFLTSLGDDRATGNHSRPLWTDLSGRVDGVVCGVALLDHPENLRHPQPVRLHPEMPYFVNSPPVLGSFEISRQAPYRARYRLVIHDEAPDAPRLDRLAAEFGEPWRVNRRDR